MHDLIDHVMSNPLLALGTIVAAFGSSWASSAQSSARYAWP